MADHWFDTLNKALVKGTQRRTLLGAATAAITSLSLGEAPGTEAAKHPRKGRGKGKGHGKGKGKGKSKQKRCAPAVLADCDSAFAGSPRDISFCKAKCARCKTAGTAFCIHGPDDEIDDVHATCCRRGDVCCGKTACCGAGQCVTCVGADFKICIDAASGNTCCPDDPVRFCVKGFQCCPGIGCTASPICPSPCFEGDGFAMCNGECVDTKVDRDHCNGCNQGCPIGASCVDGRCRCPAGQGGVCDNRCVDLARDHEHCGICNQGCLPTEECCGGSSCYNPAFAECCEPSHGVCDKQNGLRCCLLPGGQNTCVPVDQPCP